MEADVRRVQEFIVKGRTKLATLNMVLNWFIYGGCGVGFRSSFGVLFDLSLDPV